MEGQNAEDLVSGGANVMLTNTSLTPANPFIVIDTPADSYYAGATYTALMPDGFTLEDGKNYTLNVALGPEGTKVATITGITIKDFEGNDDEFLVTDKGRGVEGAEGWKNMVAEYNAAGSDPELLAAFYANWTDDGTASGTIQVHSDISFSNVSGSLRIKKLSVMIDGNGHAFSDINMSYNYEVATLAEETDANGGFRNLTIKNSSFTSSVGTAIFAYKHAGIIENCVVNNVTATNGEICGMVRDNTGFIIACHTINCAFSGSVASGIAYRGGTTVACSVTGTSLTPLGTAGGLYAGEDNVIPTVNVVANFVMPTAIGGSVRGGILGNVAFDITYPTDRYAANYYIGNATDTGTDDLFGSSITGAVTDEMLAGRTNISAFTQADVDAMNTAIGTYNTAATADAQCNYRWQYTAGAAPTLVKQ